MKRLWKIIGPAVGAITTMTAPLVYADSKSASSFEVTPPLGGEVLPGGDLSSTNIQSGVIFSKIIPYIIRYAIQLAIALAVIGLIIGGYRYITAYGATEKHDTAMKTITYSLVGLLLALAAYGIVTIITSITLT